MLEHVATGKGHYLLMLQLPANLHHDDLYGDEEERARGRQHRPQTFCEGEGQRMAWTGEVAAGFDLDLDPPRKVTLSLHHPLMRQAADEETAAAAGSDREMLQHLAGRRRRWGHLRDMARRWLVAGACPSYDDFGTTPV